MLGICQQRKIYWWKNSTFWGAIRSLQLCPTLCDPMNCSSSIGFSRQEYWSGLPHPPPGDLRNPGIKPMSLTFPALADRFFTTSASWKALEKWGEGHLLYKKVKFVTFQWPLLLGSWVFLICGFRGQGSTNLEWQLNFPGIEIRPRLSHLPSSNRGGLSFSVLWGWKGSTGSAEVWRREKPEVEGVSVFVLVCPTLGMSPFFFLVSVFPFEEWDWW